MVKLGTNINEIWPETAYQKIKEKGLSVEKLGKIFEKIYFPWTEGYNEFRFFYKLQIQELPLFVVSAKTVKEIQKFLNLAFRKKLTLRIINGRHSSNVQNPDMYLDMTHFKEISLDKNILTVGGGVNQGKIYIKIQESEKKYYHIVSTRHVQNLGNSISRHLANNDFGTLEWSGGTQPTVGAAGFTSCGGISSLKRTFGLTSDTLISCDVVIPPTPDRKAQYVRADKNNHSDLFWAIRGGLCSNFGVVVSMNFKLFEIGDVIMYSVTFPFTSASKVLRYWLNTAPSRPDTFNEDISLVVNKETEACEIGGLYVIDNGLSHEQAIQQIQTELQGLIELGGSLMFKITSYFDAVNTLAENRSYHPFSSSKVYMSSVKVNVNTILSQLEKARQLNGTFIFATDLLGGKIARKPENYSAYYPRQASFFYEIFAFTESSLNVSSINDWTSAVFNSVYNIKTDTVFIGFPIPHLTKHLKKYYGSHRHCLLQIKHKYDPTDVLFFPQGINLLSD